MKRGRPKIEKVEFSSRRLEEALAYRKKSLRKINKDSAFEISERTVRRAKKEGKINPVILDQLAKYLDVDPLLLRGDYDRNAEHWASTPEEAEKIKDGLKIEKFPYIIHEQRQLPALQYIKDLLIENEISVSYLYAMPQDTLIRFYLEMDRAVNNVLWNYFEIPQHKKYSYSYPMPPEEEIISGD